MSECGERFTTYEYVEGRTIQVLKRDGSAEDFDREKLVKSLQIACAKRPVSASQVEALADEIEDELSKQAGVEVPSCPPGRDGDGWAETPGSGRLRTFCIRLQELPGHRRVPTSLWTTSMPGSGRKPRPGNRKSFRSDRIAEWVI